MSYYEDVEDIVEDVLIEEPDLLIVRKWLVKWKHSNGTYAHSWEPYESIAHLPKFEQYEDAKKTGTLSSNKGDTVIVQQYTEEQYQRLVKHEQSQSISCDKLCGDSWGYYDNKDNYTNKQKNKVKKFKKLFDIDNDNDNDEDFDILDEIQNIRKIRQCQKRCKTFNKSEAAVVVKTKYHKKTTKKSRKKLRLCDKTATNVATAPKQPPKPPPPPQKPEVDDIEKKEIMKLKRKIKVLENKLESKRLKNGQKSTLELIPKKIKKKPTLELIPKKSKIHKICARNLPVNKMRNNKYEYNQYNETKTNRDESISTSSLALISRMKSNNINTDNIDNNKCNETKTNSEESTVKLIPMKRNRDIEKLDADNGANNVNGYDNYTIYEKKNVWNKHGQQVHNYNNYGYNAYDNNNNYFGNETEYYDYNNYNNSNYNGYDNYFNNPPKKRRLNTSYTMHGNIGYGNNYKPQQNIPMDSYEANQRSICVKSIPPNYIRRSFRAEIEDKYNVKIIKCDALSTDIPPFLMCNRLELQTIQSRNKLLKLCKESKLSLRNDFISATQYI